MSQCISSSTESFFFFPFSAVILLGMTLSLIVHQQVSWKLCPDFKDRNWICQGPRNGMNRAQGIRMMTSFHYNYQNALGQAIVFRFFFCEESLARDTNLHNKDSSEMHSGSCKGLRSHGIKITKYEWILESHNPLRARSPHATTDKIFFLAKLSSTQTLYKYR